MISLDVGSRWKHVSFWLTTETEGSSVCLASVSSRCEGRDYQRQNRATRQLRGVKGISNEIQRAEESEGEKHFWADSQISGEPLCNLCKWYECLCCLMLPLPPSGHIILLFRRFRAKLWSLVMCFLFFPFCLSFCVSQGTVKYIQIVQSHRHSLCFK